MYKKNVDINDISTCFQDTAIVYIFKKKTKNTQVQKTLLKSFINIMRSIPPSELI